MELLNSIAAFFTKLLQWWFLVMPWEQALHIRKGNILKLRAAGIYFRIPFIDAVYIQTIRMRMVDTPMQTLSTKDGSTVTIKSVIGYSIQDIEKLYNTLYHPEMTLSSMAMGFIGEYVRDRPISEVTPESISKAVNNNFSEMPYGLKDLSIKVTTFAVVKTFRLIQDGSSLYESLSMEPKK